MGAMKEKGFILVGMMFLMLLIGVTAVALNRRTGLQAQMAANQDQAAQISLGQIAAVEQAIWKLTEDPLWWTDTANKDYTYGDIAYTRTVQASTVDEYTDATTISVTAPGAANPVRLSVRYYVHPQIPSSPIDEEPLQICLDIYDNIYFALRDSHGIYRRDATTGEVTRVAGNGTSGFSGDNGPATAAQLQRPRGVAIDSSGNLYIADSDNHRIRKVTAVTGIITTIAGTGVEGFSGDTGAATSAKLNNPRMLSVLGSDVYIADTDNNVIRRIDGATQNITRVAGHYLGWAGNSGDDMSAIGFSARLNSPWGIYVKSNGDFYIADRENHQIRMVVAATGIITTVAGKGLAGYTDNMIATQAKLENPSGVFVSGDDIYIADTDNHVIRKVDGSTGFINTIAGLGELFGYTGDGGLPLLAKMDRPFGVFMDSSGDIIVADTNNLVLRKVNVGTSISSLYTSGGFGLTNPHQIALDTGGNLYVADADNNRIRKLTADGDITTVAGTGAAGWLDGAVASAQFNKPKGIAVDAAGDLYVADTDNNRIRKIDISTGIVTTIAGTSTAGYFGDGGAAVSSQLNKPHGVDIDGSGNIYVADTDNCIIRRFTEGGSIVRVAGTASCGSTVTALALTTELKKPRDVHVDHTGNLYYIADRDNHKVWIASTSGKIMAIAGTGTDAYSGDGDLAVNAQLKQPSGVHVDSSGNVHIADTGNYRLRVISKHNDFIYTLAGTGAAGYDSDDVVAASTRFDQPMSIAMEATVGGRRIYISDMKNNRIRILEYEVETLLN